MENSLKISTMKLVSMADEECQILRHSNQWVETIDPSIVAMKAILQGTTQGTTALLKQLSAHLSSLKKLPYQDTNSGDYSANKNEGGVAQGRRHGNDNPPWVYDAPDDATQKRTFWGRTWYFCTKCGKAGKWVCTHTDAMHHSSYQHHRRPMSPALHSRKDSPYLPDCKGYQSRSRTPPSSRSTSPMHNRRRSVSFRPTPPPNPKAKVSLLDSINAFISVP